MKHYLSKLASLAVNTLLISVFVMNLQTGFAQVNGDYRTRATGNWNSNATWQKRTGGAWVNCTAGDYPGVAAGSGTVTILNGHNVSLNVSPANAIGALLVGNAGSTTTALTFSSSNTLTVTGTVTIVPITTNNNNRTRSLVLNAGVLNAGNIVMNTPNADSRDAFISLTTGTINVSGNITMNSTNLRNYILFSGAGKLNIGGTITGGGITSTAGGGTNVPTSGTVNYNSSSAQNIGTYTYFNLEVSGGNTKTLIGNTAVNNTLVFTNGLLSLQNFNLTLAQTATITGSFSSTNMVLTGGTGYLVKNFATGNTTAFTFPVGENTGTTEYSPLTIDFSANSNAGTVSVNVVDATESNISNSLNYLTRYWNIQSTLSTYTYDLTFNYSASDVNIPATESELLLGWSQGTWNSIAGTTVNTTSHTISSAALTEVTAPLSNTIFSGIKPIPMFNYSVRTGNLGTTYDWIDCSDGTELTDLDIVAWAYSPLDDGYWLINWPFNFQVYNSSYSTSSSIGISTNGFLRFNGIPTNNYTTARNYDLNAAGTNIGQVLLMGITDAFFETDEERVFYKVTGTAPNRVLTIDFQNMGIYGNPYLYIDIQASFYETTNKIVMRVGNSNFERDNADIGIHSGIAGYYHYWQDAMYSTPFTWIEYTPLSSVPSPQNADSYVDDTGVTQPAAGNIASSAVTELQATDVFKFKIFDTGASDGLPTTVQRLRIYNNFPTNSADWFNLIGGVVFSDGTNISQGVLSVNPNYLDVEFDPGAFVINNGQSKEITMKIYLKNATQAENGKTFQFYLSVANHFFASDYSGSQFAATFPGANFVSNIFTINFTATELRFITEPPALAYKDAIINPIVQVALTDAAGNIANSTSGATITLSNIEGISMSGFTATLTNGVATFSSLQFSATGGPLALNTSNTNGYTNTSSDFITIAVAAILFQDDFTTDKGWTASGTPAWERGAQSTNGPTSDHTPTSVDDMCYGTVINANYGSAGDAYLTSPIFDLAGTTNPVINFWMDLSTQFPTNGGTVQMRVMNSGVWGAWTTLSLSDEGYLANAPNYSDIAGLNNGVPGWSGDIPTGDWVLTMIDISNLTTTGLTGITSSNQIQLRFWFGSTSTNTALPGWYIDDFAILYSTFPGLWKKTAISTDWATTANWDDNAIPDNTVTVTIPSGAAFYPEIDETANCFKLIVYNSGLVTLKSGGTLNVSQFLEVGEGVSGEFVVNDGTLNIGTNLHSRTGSIIRFNGGTSNFTDLRRTLNITEAAGTIHFAGGTINANGNILLGTLANGTMTGNFVINLLGNFKMNHNATNNQWPTITGGTLNMQGTSGTIISSDAGNEARIYNLNIRNTFGVSTSGSVHVFNNLDVFPAASLTNNAGNSLLVSNDFTINSDDKFTGSYIDNLNTVVSGTTTVERYIKNEVWQYIGIPVQSISSSLFDEKNFYYYDESVPDRWLNNNFVDNLDQLSSITGWIKPSGVLNTACRGYAYSYYASTINFTGTLNSGDQSIAITHTNTPYAPLFNGWNLVGNPYPSGIDLDMIDKTNMDGAVYYLDDTDDSEYNNFRYYVSGGGLPFPDFTSGFAVNDGARIIPAGQGFYVRALTNTTFNIPNSARVHTNQTQYKKGSIRSEPQNIRFYIGAKGNFDEGLLVFTPYADLNYDSSADAFKLFPGSQMPQIYSITPNFTRLAINFSPMAAEEVMQVRIGVLAPKAGNYKLRFDLSAFNEYGHVYFKDRLSNTFTEITSNQELDIYADAGQHDNRFALYFSNKNLTSVDDWKDAIIEYTNNKITVTSYNTEFEGAGVLITNASGQTIGTGKLNQGQFTLETEGLAKGVYMCFIIGLEKHTSLKLML